MGKAIFMFWRIKLATSGALSGIWSGMSCGIRDIAPSSEFLTPQRDIAVKACQDGFFHSMIIVPQRQIK